MGNCVSPNSFLCRLVLAARRIEELEAVVAECIKEGAEAIGIIADVAKQDQVLVLAILRMA